MQQVLLNYKNLTVIADPVIKFLCDDSENKIIGFLCLSGREINNGMEKYLVSKIKNITKIKSQNKKILLFGITYKSNVADIRNSIPLNIWRTLKIKYKKKNRLC